MEELTKTQIERQDEVDNAIYQVLQEVNPTDKNIGWDIEMIGDVRSVIRKWFVEKKKFTDEQSFYPYLEN